MFSRWPIPGYLVESGDYSYDAFGEAIGVRRDENEGKIEPDNDAPCLDFSNKPLCCFFILMVYGLSFLLLTVVEVDTF